MKESKQVIKLRGHHLLCLQGYQGYGYDEKFKKNMENVLNKLKESKIEVVISKDDICSYCPFLKEEKCLLNCKGDNSTEEEIAKSNETIVKMDLNVLKKIAIEKNKIYNADELFNKINNTITNIKDLNGICTGCRWIKECLWYQSKI